MRGSNRVYAVDLIRAVCALAGSPSYLDDLRKNLAAHGVLTAVASRTNDKIFDWLAASASLQGISDEVARKYMARHGRPRWAKIEAHLLARPSCPKLASYWTFAGCQYRKSTHTCAEPDHFDCCPLPASRFRNGTLSQLAYSLALYIRDVADGDLVGWIDTRLAAFDLPDAPDRIDRMRAAVIEPLINIFGVSDKVINMSFANLLLGAGIGRPRWLDVGASMIAIDTLVHNFLVRTGILGRAGAHHPYGPHCYARGGCADLIRSISADIDARAFNRAFPKDFPRFVQSAIWRYCAQEGLNTCNGNRIDDRGPCRNRGCRLFERCDRRGLSGAGKN